MRYISVTEVDAVTKIPCNESPMRTGPSMPEVKGLKIDWSNMTDWPITCNPDGSYSEAPRYYGFVDDDADIAIAGVLSEITESEFESLKRAEYYKRRVNKK